MIQSFDVASDKIVPMLHFVAVIMPVIVRPTSIFLSSVVLFGLNLTGNFWIHYETISTCQPFRASAFGLCMVWLAAH